METNRDLPPPMDPKKEVVTMDRLSDKLDSQFKNIKEFVHSIANGIQNTLGAQIQNLNADVKIIKRDIDIIKRDIDITQHGVSEHTKIIKEVEIRLSNKIDKIGERLEIQETKLEEHISIHP